RRAVRTGERARVALAGGVAPDAAEGLAQPVDRLLAAARAGAAGGGQRAGVVRAEDQLHRARFQARVLLHDHVVELLAQRLHLGLLGRTGVLDDRGCVV